MASDSRVSETNKKIYWVPLESSPEAMNKMVYRLGVDKAVGFNDVWGLDDELLEMVAQPVHALIFLFPSLEEFQAARKQKAASSSNKVSPNVWFMRQTIGNACGTMAIIHALANIQKTVPISGPLGEFFEKTKNLSPAERATELEKNESIAALHSQSAVEGQTTAPEADADILHHYSAFVNVDGDLYELDGTTSAPLNHGPSNNLLKDAARVIKEHVKSLNDDPRGFSVISLGPNLSEN
ncbi:ubiquitin carboxyl-terminal hydrolase isozyme L3 [Coemansia reversa NRRL 1564]|uniref:Ubiquitin carboxyl-terminal hydrolase n=1 Tax=Coemansia reversa (strain ATCC 12441 / NRRL 1564) TaxID=763665 RepID=A0A2G5BL16_COERN|nr:ubiquitin carboxyl-terminal hydrolase isozyme L3 [Coemansia reversa NRRL 1564]|eukprot:PIA19693.1 ubiquitin carboxyl-terminal hydrolase isozyme L3 [Coemansia reversa NRRL 1564]